jgi:hypothetical protein
VEPELVEPSPLLLELLELAVVPVLPESDWRADMTATDNPVPPMPTTAVAIAAAEARRNQRRRGEGDSSNVSVVTMAVSLPGGSSAALQENVKRPSSSAERCLRDPSQVSTGR